MGLIKTVKNNYFLKRLALSIFWFFTDYIYNHVFHNLPCWRIRKLYLIFCKASIGNGSRIDMNCSIQDPNRLIIGNNSYINRMCILDARGSIVIKDRVTLSQRVGVVTGSHDMQSKDFDYVRKKVIIEKYVFIGYNATILGGVTIGEGAVVSACAVVTKDVEPYSIVAGIPAKKIGERNKELTYIPLKGEYNWPKFT